MLFLVLGLELLLQYSILRVFTTTSSFLPNTPTLYSRSLNLFSTRARYAVKRLTAKTARMIMRYFSTELNLMVINIYHLPRFAEFVATPNMFDIPSLSLILIRSLPWLSCSVFIRSYLTSIFSWRLSE